MIFRPSDDSRVGAAARYFIHVASKPNINMVPADATNDVATRT
jgi:hypothetical protein